MLARSVLVRFLAIATLLLVACQPSAPPATQPAAQPAAQPKAAAPTAQRQAAKPAPKGATRITVAVTETMDSANPYNDSVAFLYSVWCEVYGCLVAYDDKKGDYGNHGIALAESWTVENPNTWVFKLHKGVRFSDGTPLTAADIVHSFNFIQKNPTSKQQANLPKDAEAVAVDDHTVKIITKEPVSSLLDYIADRWIITSKAMHEKYGDKVWEQKAVGAGPYTLKEFVPGQHIVLTKVANWWRGPVEGPDEVVYRLIREPEVRVTALLNNEVQLAQTIPPHMAERIKNSPNHKVVSVDSTEIMFFAMQPKPPFDKKEVRQAVAYAIDRDAIVKNVLQGYAQELNGPIGPGQYGYDSTVAEKVAYKYDPAKARELLAKAGFPNGLDVELSTPVGRYTQDKQISEAVAQMLTQAGIRTKLLTPEWSTLWDNVQKGRVPFYYMGRGSVVDPGRPLSQYFETGGSPRVGYSNPGLDELFKKERAAFDPAERKKVLGELFTVLTDEAPGVFMWRHKLLWGSAKNVEYTPPISERYYAHEMRVK